MLWLLIELFMILVLIICLVCEVRMIFKRDCDDLVILVGVVINCDKLNDL